MLKINVAVEGPAEEDVNEDAKEEAIEELFLFEIQKATIFDFHQIVGT